MRMDKSPWPPLLPEASNAMQPLPQALFVRTGALCMDKATCRASQFHVQACRRTWRVTSLDPSMD